MTTTETKAPASWGHSAAWLALSLRQPWAYAVAHCGKRLENRDRYVTKHRGHVLLHASAGCTKKEYEAQITSMSAAGLIRRTSTKVTRDNGHLPTIPPLETLTRGGIFARAIIVGCLAPETGQVATDGAPTPIGVHGGVALDGADLLWMPPELGTPGHKIERFDLRWRFPGSYTYLLHSVELLRFTQCSGALGLWGVKPALVEALGLPPTPPAWP